MGGAGMKKLRLALEPKITDGDTWCICKNQEELWSALDTYAQEYGVNKEKITIELREMTDEEVDNLQEI